MVSRLAVRLVSSFSVRKSRFSSHEIIRKLWLTSAMSKDHLEVTKDSPRIPEIHPAIVDSIHDISPTVKELIVTVDSVKNQEFTFLPGQWVDMFIPGVEKVGGFSITSTPRHYQNTRQIKLAVKFSTWPPAQWVHTKCQNGSKVELRSGGDFALDNVEPGANYVFVAGGVGINPIVSMIQHLKDVEFQGRISLLFSVQNIEELIFRDLLDEILSKSPLDFRKYFVTRKTPKCETHGNSSEILFRRLTLQDIRSCLTNTTDKNLMYVCGPPAMIRTVLDANLPDVNIYHENWWA